MSPPRKRKREPEEAVPRTVWEALARLLGRARPLEAALGVVAALALVLALRASPGLRDLLCGPEPRHDLQTLIRPAPTSALPGQLLAPCAPPGEARRGVCWSAVRDERGEQLKDCRASEALYDLDDGLCWLPLLRKSSFNPPRASDSRVVIPL